MKTFTDYMNEGRKQQFFPNTQSLKFADGNSMSVQASSYHYCSPRTTFDDFGLYDSFEVGFPSKHYDSLEQYKDGPGDQTESVFGWVPKEVIEKIINDAGGVVGFHSWE